MKQMLLPRISLIVLLAAIYQGAGAQDIVVPGWHPLPDSLFVVWRLEPDQIRRIRVIEEDHEMERTAIISAGGAPEARDRRLSQLAQDRLREIRAVLQVKQFEDWERRSAGLEGR